MPIFENAQPKISKLMTRFFNNFKKRYFLLILVQSLSTEFFFQKTRLFNTQLQMDF